MEVWKEYQEKNKERFLNEMIELVAHTICKCKKRTQSGYDALCRSGKETACLKPVPIKRK